MNSRETEYYTVIRDGEQIKVPASKFYSTGGLSLPTQSYDSYQEHLEDEAQLLADWDKHQGQPTVAMNKDPYLSQDYQDNFEQPIQELEEGGLPSLPTLNHRRLS